jgi:hypothetical protein
MGCCREYFEVCDKVPDCLEELGVITPVSDEDVNLFLTDKFKNLYLTEGVTESNGLLVIGLTQFPDQLINPYSGNFILEVYRGNELIKFSISGVEYDGLIFSCASVTPKQANYTIDVFNTTTEYV